MINSELARTVAHFEELPFPEQAAIIWQRGQPLATRHLPGFRLHLYNIDGFFVEMWICKRRFIVTLIRAFSATDDLMTYVEPCSLADLFPVQRRSGV